jgi:hypothetical protein
MDRHAILLIPRYAPGLEVLWRNVLPRALHLEAEMSGPGHLDVAPRYHGRATDGPTVRMSRWDLTHDEATGRILRLAFHDDRDAPRLPYDEIVDAFTTVNLAFATAKHGAEPYRLGLAMATKLLLAWLHEDEDLLRRGLTPPFAGASA